MLQIIGWLACAFLVVKWLELLGRAEAHSTERPDDIDAGSYEKAGAWLAFFSAVVFAGWLFIQGRETTSAFGELDVPDHINVNVN